MSSRKILALKECLARCGKSWQRDVTKMLLVHGEQVLHRVGEKESVVLANDATSMPIASIRFKNVDPRIRGADLCFGGITVARLTREDLLSADNALTGPFFADDLPLGRAKYHLIFVKYDIDVPEQDIEKHVETLWKPSDDPEDLVPCYDSDCVKWCRRAVPYQHEFDAVTLWTPDVYIEHAPDAPADKACRVWTPIVVDGDKNPPLHPNIAAEYPLDGGPLPPPGTTVRRRFANKLRFAHDMAGLAVTANWD